MQDTSDRPENDVFSAIADPTRRQILDLVSERDHPVRTLAAAFPMSRPAISKHLRILKQAGLVSERKVGRERYYHLQPEPLRQVGEWVGEYERFWRERLERLGNGLEGRE